MPRTRILERHKTHKERPPTLRWIQLELFLISKKRLTFNLQQLSAGRDKCRVDRLCPHPSLFAGRQETRLCRSAISITSSLLGFDYVKSFLGFWRYKKSCYRVKHLFIVSTFPMGLFSPPFCYLL